jgi:hypothetical protein
MPRLTAPRYRAWRHRAWRPHVRDDSGAAATLVAVLLAGGVLLGMTALVVDVGLLYTEREELLSGADAAATAVALDCALSRPQCADDLAAGVAVGYAGLNARDGVSDATVCGHVPGRLSECTDDLVGNLTDCLGERPTDGTRYVEVRTTTRLPDGDTLLPPRLAQAFVSGYEGTTVGACARVGWGSPGEGIAVTISACEFDNATRRDEDPEPDLAPPPPPDPDPSYEVVIKLHTIDPECEAPPPGFDGPGGFGWLEGTDCRVDLEERADGIWYFTIPGARAPADCRNGDGDEDTVDTLSDYREHKTVLLIPVFNDVRGTGANLEYHLASVEAFVLTGYHLPGLDEGSNLPGSTITECTGEDFCIYGYFTTDVSSGPIGPLPGFGVAVLKTIG